MSHVETLQAILERRLISQMVRVLDGAVGQQRESHLRALRDLVQYADPSLDARLFDEWIEERLRRFNLWAWDSAGDLDHGRWSHA